MIEQSSHINHQRPKTVVIVQRYLTHYRVPLFTAMRDVLARHNIQLRVLVGEATRAERQKRDSGQLTWAEPVATTYFMNGRLCWQPISGRVAGTDLVIVTQENKLISNMILLSGRRHTRVALWGHGANLQSSRGPLESRADKFKQWQTRRADWWFAYTDMSRQLFAEAGVPIDRITVLNNTIDTTELRRQLAEVNDGRLEAHDVLNGIGKGPLLLCLGSLYEDKRLVWALDAARLGRDRFPDLQLVFAGDGPQRGLVQQWAQTYDWVRWVGPVSGLAKAVWLKRADVLLNPGAVGLVILDAFAAGKVMITSHLGNHGPEIAYLRDGHNGIISANHAEAFAQRTLDVLSNRTLRLMIQQGAFASADLFSIEAMSQNFARGIVSCLNAHSFVSVPRT